MKNLKNLLKTYRPPLEPIDSPKMIRWHIRDGKAVVLSPLKKVCEMVCERCGGNSGSVCRHEGNEFEKDFYAWFCAEEECIYHSAEISKQQERKKWQLENARRQEEAAIEMKNKQKTNMAEERKNYKSRFFKD